MREQAYAAWLERYKLAWEKGDPEEAAALFALDASTRRHPSASRCAAATRYGSIGATARNVSNAIFAFGARSRPWPARWAFAHWRCTFTRAGSGERVELDDMFRCTFEPGGLCARFQEWWHRRTLA